MSNLAISPDLRAGIAAGAGTGSTGERRITMEVKIGIQMAPRELVVETESSAEEITQALAAALSDRKLFVIADKRGGTVLVPGEKIAYVELDQIGPRQIGFGNR
jgi:hypothetical protein